MRVFAICSKSARVVEKTQTLLSNSTRFEAEIDCPAGFKTTGGGGSFEGTPNGAYLASSFPGDAEEADPNARWSTYANNTTGLTQRLTARVLCTKL